VYYSSINAGCRYAENAFSIMLSVAFVLLF
jgi:hypothetical protein